METIYLQTLGTYRLFVDVGHISKGIDNYLETTLKGELEGKCKSDGYVKPESVRIMKRSLGYMAGSHFTGKITYDIVYACDICNPAVGNLVKARITNINKLGFLAENGPLMILVARQYYENKDMFKNLEVNQEVMVEVIGKRFQLNDHKIEIIGKIYQEGANVSESGKIKTVVVGNTPNIAAKKIKGQSSTSTSSPNSNILLSASQESSKNIREEIPDVEAEAEEEEIPEAEEDDLNIEEEEEAEEVDDE